MRCSFCLEKGIPEPKLAKLEIIKVPNQLQRATSRATKLNEQVLAACNINLTLHFGEKYREQTVKMEPVSGTTRTTVLNITYYA